MDTIINYAVPISLVLVTLMGVFFGGWLKIVNETNGLLKAQNLELKEINKDLLEKYNSNVRQIENLSGQINVLKSVPLISIDATLKQLAVFNESLVASNKAILDRLERSANLLVKDTASAAKEVKEVKTDLENA